jgi:hypothetical protein
VFNIDEFRTSCLCYKTEEKCENLHLKFNKDPNQKIRKMHSILTYKMENSRTGCINRDKMDAKHPKIVRFIYGERRNPLKYRRDYKFQQDMLTTSSIMLVSEAAHEKRTKDQTTLSPVY